MRLRSDEGGFLISLYAAMVCGVFGFVWHARALLATSFVLAAYAVVFAWPTDQGKSDPKQGL